MTLLSHQHIILNPNPNSSIGLWNGLIIWSDVETWLHREHHSRLQETRLTVLVIGPHIMDIQS